MNKVEQECIILDTAWAMIDGMVNWSMFVKRDDPKPTNLLFETSGHAQLFNILLGDFLSVVRPFKGQPAPFGLAAPPSNTRASNLTFLAYLRQVVGEPSLGHDSLALGACVEAFGDWLERETLAKGVNLSDIGVVADIRVQRYRYLKICGDIAKHNLTRLATNVGHIRALLDASGHPVSEQDAYLAVPNFFEWFHDNIFIYHSSLIAEFLNNIRWAVFEYLQPEFRRSWHPKGSPIQGAQMYAYHYPQMCTEPIAKAMYWELMNRVRKRPYVRPFTVADAFKQLY